YLNTLRIRHACVLIEQGISGVKDISNLCGFSDPMYFSRLFKAKLGVSPREYVRTHNLYDVE
ncbi:MAG: helix-turn-helix transcriptional regulator, partial [Oscillospiraceae bacterium]|nr:helix-turn-helix transcriptional regulator [Oscillospiraceae bacterium]